MRLSTFLIIASALVLAVSFWYRNDLPANIDYRPEIANEPRQTASDRAPFDIRYSDIDYRVEPEYDYELNGVVVSYRHHDGTSRMHRLSSDHLNIADICVIWGSNVLNPHLDRMRFWNGIFTCNVKTRDTEAWQAFDMSKLSNNHLISGNPEIRNSLSDVRIGDQIRIRGSLASYTGPVGTRGTSTTRSDTGDGACETIYVDTFRIVQPANNPWRLAMAVSFVTLIAGLALHFRRPYRPYAKE